ncbi:glycosyltransferase family 2 protein [Nocardioides sp.]|uniref:glycosyltransferase family 2 protein n=1 Tax=Nocardioides sp. TaxID=35761 RepID=UPI0027273301|nr:glycosyltransferase family 2 protein [Nocardioides sp.]MDO9454766.1 glycosyltransferase family 2 protein [Nocardioides sp.]
MPVLDEEPYLEESVRRVLDQDYEGEVELVLAIAPSQDRTAEIAERLASVDRRVRVVSNPAGRTPTALNLAVGAASHDFVVRVDAHGFLPDGYLHEVVKLLEVTGAANVGGMMRVEGEDDFGRAVARAMTSPLGIGGSRFHVGGQSGPARTVYLGAFRRDALEKVGGFDEHFWRAQDWELNYRLRLAGETVWFTPDLSVGYRPRRTPKALARQFHGSGRWRREIVRLHPETASLRYLAAPVVTAAITLGTLVGLLGLAVLPVAPTWLAAVLLVGWLAPLGYGGGVLVATALMGRGLPLRARLWLPVVVGVMHLAWGAGFWRSIPQERRRLRQRPTGPRRTPPPLEPSPGAAERRSARRRRDDDAARGPRRAA